MTSKGPLVKYTFISRKIGYPGTVSGDIGYGYNRYFMGPSIILSSIEGDRLVDKPGEEILYMTTNVELRDLCLEYKTWWLYRSSVVNAQTG